MLKLNSPIVSVEWLMENLEHPNLILLDATMKKATDKSDTQNNEFIKNTLFFDIEHEFSDTDAPFPNTLLSPKLFEENAQAIGVNDDSFIIVYDCYGYYSCARVWFMFKAMGFENIAVLDGGLPSWKEANFPLQGKPSVKFKGGNFKVGNYSKIIHDHQNVLDAIEDKKTTIIDARSANRFLGLVDEPRKGLRSGHIPNSKNLPFTNILNGSKMKSNKDFENIF